jgi:hypothetical protein
MSSSDLHGIITGLNLPTIDDRHSDLLSPFHAQLTPMKQKLLQKDNQPEVSLQRSKSAQEMPIEQDLDPSLKQS